MRIGFVILNYKTYQMTIDLVNRIKERIKNLSYEIIVVDNGSPNESAEILKDAASDFIFIANTRNAGYAAGNNIGIKYAVNHDNEYVLVMNNDIDIPSEDVIHKMIKLMESNKAIAAVSPKIVDGKGKHDPPIYFRKPNYWDLTLGIFRYQKERFQIDENQNFRVYAPRGSFMLLRGKAIKAVDFLDENTFLYYEEPILAERLTAKGFECWHCGETEVIHNHAVTISSTFNKRNMAKNVCRSYRYYLKEYRKFNHASIGLCVIIRYLAIMIRR